MKTVRQQLLEFAYDKVTARAKSDKEKAKDTYGIWCHGLPGLIRTSGLAGAMAFLKSKEKPEGKELGFKWLLEDLRSLPGIQAAGLFKPDGSLNTNLDSGKYMLATRRTLEALPFFKRFAESILDVKADVRLGDEE